MHTEETKSFLRNYRKLLSLLLDDIYAEARSFCDNNGHEISCRKGCTSCCFQFISVNIPHAALVVDFLNSNSPVMEHFLKGYDAWLRAFDANPDALSILRKLEEHTSFVAAASPCPQELLYGYHKLAIPCSFLDEGECSIRTVRPVVCAAYFSVSPVEHCHPDSKVQPLILDVLPPENCLRQLTSLSHRNLVTHQEPLPTLVHKIITKGLPAVVDEVGRLFESKTSD